MERLEVTPALSWQLFILQWRLYTKLVQDPCKDGIDSWIFVLSAYILRFYTVWSTFDGLESSHKRYKKDVKENNFCSSDYSRDSPNIYALCKRIFKEGGDRTWVWKKKKKEMKIQTHTYLCRFLQLYAIMQKFPKASELSGIYDGLFSRYILKLSESLQNLHNCWCFHLSEHNCLYFSVVDAVSTAVQDVLPRKSQRVQERSDGVKR